MQLYCNNTKFIYICQIQSSLIQQNGMENTYDVIIIGGSYAGLSAAMALGRSLRKVLIIDSGLPCNRHTPHSHNFLTQDGETPAAIAQKAKKQVEQYPGISFLKDKATEGKKTYFGFEIKTESSKTFSAKKLLFATGVNDIMPNINGFEDCWAISVIHCPYCHGYEVKGKKTAILANGDAALHYTKLLKQLTNNITIFTNGPADFDNNSLSKLKEHDISIIEDKITKLKHSKGQVEQIFMQNGDVYDFPVIYYRPKNTQHCNIPQELGCEINEMGYLTVNQMQQTSVPGIYAAGDNCTPARSVALAVAGGMMAGAGINADLASEVF